MKVLRLIVCLLPALWLCGKWLEAHDREQMIAVHKFKLTMPAGDVIASLGQPAARMADPNTPRREYWDYPTVVIEMVDGIVVDSRRKP